MFVLVDLPSGGGKISWQAAATAGAFSHGVFIFWYMYPFELTRSITIIVLHTDYGPDDESLV